MLGKEGMALCKKEKIDWNNKDAMFGNVLRSVINTIKNKGNKESNALEEVTLGWLLVRLCAAQDAGCRGIDIDRLFGFRSYDNFGILEAASPRELAVRFSKKKPKIKYHEIIDKEGLDNFEINVGDSKQSIDIARVFNKHMTHISTLSTLKWQVLRPKREKNPDLILVFQNAGTKKPFVIFLDCKSQINSVKFNKKKVKVEDEGVKKLTLQQYRYTENLQQGLIALSKMEQLDPVSQAVADGDFLFIYMCTHPIVKFYKDEEKKIFMLLKDIPKNVKCMKAEECKNFFGCMFPFYEEARKMNEKH
jgi:hypothetical protein